MNVISFRDKIIALQQEWLQDPFDTKRNQDFWFVMDSISDELAIKWSERTLGFGKHTICLPAEPSELLAIANIIHTYKTDTNKTQLTPSQKRKLIFQIIRYWDDLEMNHYC